MNEKRAFLIRLFNAVIAAADPTQALKRYFPHTRPKGRTLVVGFGKGSADMALAFEKLWQDADFGKIEGVIVTCYGQNAPLQHLEIMHASHPVPDENSIKAGRRICQAVAELGEDDQLIVLVSGGGSALLTAPAAGLTLEDKIALNQSLLTSGAPISVMNAIRQQASLVKGGRLARLAHPAKVISYIISDVPGDDPALVSSGPTVARAFFEKVDTGFSTKNATKQEAGVVESVNQNENRSSHTTIEEVINFIQNYHIALTSRLEAFFANLAKNKQTDFMQMQDFSRDEVYLVASARNALLAACDQAKREGIEAVLLSDALEGEARDVAYVHGGLVREIKQYNQPFRKPVVLLSGGETTVTLAQDGKAGGGSGGRNSEFSLALAQAIAGLDGVSALAADTDGIDGSSQSAGAFCDGSTLSRLCRQKIDPLSALHEHDSARAFESIGDLFITGPTGTNVNDFRAILVE